MTISLVVRQGGLLQRAKDSGNVYKKAEANESNELDEYGQILGNVAKEAGVDSDSGNGGDSGSTTEKITYTDTDGKKQELKKDTPAGTKIGTTTVDGQTLDWYLFDINDDNKTAYFVSTPTYWVPDTSKEVNGAWVPKLVSSSDGNTNAMRQAIQKLANGTNSYSSSSVKYTPSDDTLEYFKNVNSKWSAQRGSTAFASLNENEQAACYLADADIFAGIKEQVNSAEGNLKGKIKTLVGGASAEQWCTAYNKQTAASSSKITCEYQATKTPGYIYKVNDTAQNSGWWTNNKTIVGSDIYGAAYTNGNTSNNPFYSFWLLASPSSISGIGVCVVYGNGSYLYRNDSYYSNLSLSLFASVEL